jgi:hypothetical protein
VLEKPEGKRAFGKPRIRWEKDFYYPYNIINND